MIEFEYKQKGAKIMHEYYQRLRDVREDNDFSQEDIAMILKITRPQYTLYETGKRYIPIKYLRILAKKYKVSIDYLVGDTDIPTRYPKSNSKN